MSFNNQYWHLQRAGGEALILKTTKSGTFSMTITTSSTVDVDWGDGNSDAGVSGVITHSYADSSEKTISVTNDLDLITSFNCEFNNLNPIDLSSLVSCTFFAIGSNSNLSEIINPTSSAIITTYNAASCNLNSLDVSGFSNLGGVFSVFGNSNLSSILFPASSRDFSLLYAYSCNLASIDLSPLSGNVANLSLHSNSNLSTITLCADITNILLYSCDLGVVDFSGTTYNSIRVENNNMTAAEVNETLVNLDTQGLTSKNLNISGTNAAPDGTSGGFDGLTAKTNLQGKGWTVTTS